MSKRKDRERALRDGPFRNTPEPKLSPVAVDMIAKRLDDKLPDEELNTSESKWKKDELKDIKLLLKLAKIVPSHIVATRLRSGLQKDFKNKAKEFKQQELQCNAETVFQYYWQEKLFRELIQKVGMTQNEVSNIAYIAVGE